MIVAAVVCPHPPLLLRELSGARDAVPELRAACHEALRTALASKPDCVVVVGGADETRDWDPSLPVDVHSFGTTDAPHVEGLPLSLGVARRLLDEVGWDGPLRFRAVAWDAIPAEVAAEGRCIAEGAGRVVLVVLGEGSARPGDKPPGYLDPRAAAFDDEIARALGDGDAAALSRLDPVLAEDLMMLGRAVFGVLGEAVVRQGRSPRATLAFRDNPYGVTYAVALWDLAQPEGDPSC